MTEIADELPRNRQGRSDWWKRLPEGTVVETVWERQMQFAGMDAYEQARSSDREASETQAGQKFLRKLLTKATPALKRIQNDIIKASVPRERKSTLIVVPAETMALLGLKKMIDKTYLASMNAAGANYQVVAKEIGRSVEIELNFRNWIRASRAAAKAFAEATGKPIPQSYAEKFLEERKESRQTIHNWRKTIERMSDEPWTDIDLHYCGEAILLTVAKALPEVFEVHNVFTKGKMVKHVRMTDHARDLIDKAEGAAAAHRVIKKPMLIAPQPWKRTE